MISQDDIDAMRDTDGRLPKEFYLTDPVFQHMQWAMRAAFEEGYNAHGRTRGQSQIDPKKGKWFDYWMASQSRAELVKNGLITGLEMWK